MDHFWRHFVDELFGGGGHVEVPRVLGDAATVDVVLERDLDPQEGNSELCALVGGVCS